MSCAVAVAITLKPPCTEGANNDSNNCFTHLSAATGRWPVLLPALGIHFPAGGRAQPCPVCGGKDRFRFDNLQGAAHGYVTTAVAAMA